MKEIIKTIKLIAGNCALPKNQRDEIESVIKKLGKIENEIDKDKHTVALFEYVVDTVNDKSLNNSEFRNRVRGLVDSYKDWKSLR